MTIVCGDSHTSTHGAFGALAQGIGTSEVEHVLATQTLRQLKSQEHAGDLHRRRRRPASAPRTIALALIGRDRHQRRHRLCDRIRRRGDRGAVDGGPHDPLQHDHRGRRPRRADRAGRDDLRLRRWAARRRPRAAAWEHGRSTTGDELRQRSRRACSTPRSPSTCPPSPPPSPGAPAPRTSSPIDRPCSRSGRCSTRRARHADPPHARLHGPRARPADRRGRASTGCSSARAPTAASRTCAPPPPSPRGRKVADHVRAMVVPGSGLVKEQAEAEGLDTIFSDAGFDWREPGCSMCLGMNPDRLAPGRTLRLDLQPQLRGPPGPRRPHPSDEPAPWPPPPPSPAASPTCGTICESP